MANTPATRVNGAAITSLVASPVPAGAGGLWWDGNTTGPLWRKADGIDITLGAGGGGSTGNYTFSANNVTLTGAATATMFTSVATGLTIGGTNLTSGYTITAGGASTVTTTTGGLTLSAAGTVNVQSSSGAAVIGNTTGIVNYRSGSTGSFDLSAASGVFKTTTDAHTFGSASWAVPANTVITGASSATNTTGLNLTTTVADGASSIGLLINNAAATTSAIATRWQNNGNNRLQVELDTIVAGSAVIRQPGTTYLGLFDSGNAGVKVQGGAVYLRDGSNDRVQIDSQGMHLNASGAAGFFPHYNTQSGTTYTVLVTDTYVGLSNTAARTVTLPAANSAVGQLLTIKDEACTAGTGNITINRTSTDTIVTTTTGNTSVVINSNGGVIVLLSDGVSKWIKQN